MVEPKALTLGTIVAALVAEAAQRSPADASAHAELVDMIRRRFAESEDEQASSALAQVESKPASAPEARELAALVDERSAWDARFRTYLARQVAEARDEGVDVSAIVKLIGSQIAQEISLRASQATVTHTRPPPPPGYPAR